MAGWLDPRHRLPQVENAAAGVDTAESAPHPHHPDLFDLLRQKRKELADQAGVPPYAVFPDKTLTELATFFPQTEEDFLNTFGVGKTKLEKYGPAFLSLITAFCTAHAISDAPAKKPPGPVVPETVTGEKRHVQVARLYHNGMSVMDIAEQFHVKQLTVTNHLYRYFQDGNRIESGHVTDGCAAPPDVQEKVRQAFDTHGHQFLKPVFEALDREIPYEDLHLLRIHYLYMNHVGPTPKTDENTNPDPGQHTKKAAE